MTRCKVMFFFGIIQVGGMLLYHLADFHCSKWRKSIVANGGFLLYDLAVLSTGQERVRGKDAYLSEFDKSYRDAHSHL